MLTTLSILKPNTVNFMKLIQIFVIHRYATAQGPSFDRSVASGYSSSRAADPSSRGAPKKFEFTFPNSNLPPSGSEVSQLCLCM